MDDSTKKFMLNQLMWIGIYFALSIAISIAAARAGLPWPASLVILIIVIFGIAFWRRRSMMRRMGQGGGSFFGAGNPFGSRSIDYYCMNCGTKHNKAACPNCGSKLKKAGF
jgi:hypothetical protein